MVCSGTLLTGEEKLAPCKSRFVFILIGFRFWFCDADLQPLYCGNVLPLAITGAKRKLLIKPVVCVGY
jgi:hypothetical protein